MATTSLWHIKGQLCDLIDYVENPDKTNLNNGLKDFINVFSYDTNPNKTNNKQFVTAINCKKEIALQQIILTKKQFNKQDKYRLKSIVSVLLLSVRLLAKKETISTFVT